MPVSADFSVESFLVWKPSNKGLNINTMYTRGDTMKRNFFSLLLVVFIIGIISGCGSKEGGTDSSQTSTDAAAELQEERITITFYSVAGGDEYYNDILIPLFEEQMSGKYEVLYARATPQEIISKIKAQGQNPNIDVVVTGLDGLPMGINEGVWKQLIPEFEEEVRFEELNDIARTYVEKFNGYGVPVTVGPGGPVLAYNSDKVEQPPTTFVELKSWISENPGKFMYAAVSSSGPARGFFFGLIQSLGEDMNDPQSLTQTWEYLSDIGQMIDSYPSKTSDTFNFLYDGTVDIIPHSPFWYASLKAEGIVPPNIQAVKMEDAKQIIDAHFYAMVNNLPEEKEKAVLEFINFAMSKEAQSQMLSRAMTPVNENVSADLILPDYQETYQNVLEFALPDFKDGDQLIIPEGEWVLFPDIDIINDLYTQWEERILAQ